jgi:hypothetical protein
VTGQLAKVGQRGGPLGIAKLGARPASELGIPVEIMTVPLAQLVRRRDVLAQVVEVGPLFAEPRGHSRSTSTRGHSRSTSTRCPSLASGGSYTRRTCTFAALAIRFPDWLSLHRSIGGGLLDGELRRRVCLKALVRDWRAATDGAIVRAVFDPLASTIERRVSVPQASGHGIVDPLLRQWLRGIRRIALGLMIICPVHAEIGEQLLHLRTVRV